MTKRNLYLLEKNLQTLHGIGHFSSETGIYANSFNLAMNRMNLRYEEQIYGISWSFMSNMNMI